MYARLKLSLILLIALFPLGTPHSALAGAPAKPADMLVEAEDFQFSGGWRAENPNPRSHDPVSRFLMAVWDRKTPRPDDAATAVRVARAGRYAVWVYSRDYAALMPRTRRYKLAVDGTELPREGGVHGAEGWAWERLGEVQLAAGDHMLSLRHVNSSPRCDCIVLTTDAQSPETWNRSRRVAAKITPVKLAVEAAAPPRLAADPRAPRKGVALLANELMRIDFEAAPIEGAPAGREMIVKKAEIRLVDGRWAPLPRFGEDERLLVMKSQDPGLKFPSTVPRNPIWRSSVQAFRVEVGGREYPVRAGMTNNPFCAAEAEELTAVAARQVSEREVELKYQAAGGLQATGRWSLAPGARDLRFALTLTPQADSYYSVGLCAFGAVKKEEAKFVQLPPLYQFQRLPETPVLISSAMTPQPLVMVEREIPGGTTVTTALVAEPEALDFVWPNVINAKYGFSLLNAARQVQPCAFSPVLGYEGSRWPAGKPQTVAWRLFAASGDWKAALEHISNDVMELRDYRQPLGASLTDAALNMIDLMLDADRGGWDAEMKSFYDIETQGMGKQAAPLVILSAAMLTRDPRFWRERALPTLEFTLSRERFDFIDPDRADPKREGTPARLVHQLQVPTRYYGTSYWQGAHELLLRLNPWLEEFILPGGKPAFGLASNSSLKYAEWLAAWRYRPDPAFLREAVREADDFLAKQVYGPQTKVVGWMPFYNISFYPNWWNLLDLFEATGEARYREAALEGAFHTMAGLWSHPRVPAPPTQIVIHQGGSVLGESHIWSKDGKPYRLGWPRQAGDTPEHKVPAWTVAQAGVGLEQPSTYAALTTATGMRNIMNATWAPHLLRAYEATGRDIFRTYARNAIIGRFANYPGYYLRLFTDVVHDPDYPKKGPDLTSFYYHHIPVHLGFTLDWLVTEASVRSGGKVRFPYVIQKDYAWFNNRVYGAMPGEVFGDQAAALWLDRAIAPCRSVDIDWLAARSPGQVHLMMMNQLHQPVTVPLTLNAEKLGLKSGNQGLMRTNEDRTAKIPITKEAPFDPANTKEVTIPALGMVTLSLPAEGREPFPPREPLKKGHVKTQAGAPWGELHAFRIRSPLGGDSLYVVLTGQPPKGSRAELSLDGANQVERRRFPYEFSLAPAKESGEAKIRVRLQAPGSGTQELEIAI